MSTGTWKLNGEKRWQINVILETSTPLHIGCGEFCEHEDLVNNESHVDVNACIKGKNNLPIIPGSTIKGKFYEWLKTRNVESNHLQNLFGKGHDRGSGDQGRGGKAEFHDAGIIQALTGKQTWPFWCENSQTYIETSTAIDRHQRSALQQSLHHTETVPPGIHFQFVITGIMSDHEAALLIAALDSFDKHQNQPCFGANDANGYGRMKLYGHLQVKKMGSTEITEWLADFTNNDTAMAMENTPSLDQSNINELIKQGKILFGSNNSEARLDLVLNFDGPFLVNDPFAVKQRGADQATKTDHYPLLDKNAKSCLPTSSFRGVLRSQAERIIRTLGGTCCDTKTPCDPIYKTTDLNKLCLACQVFGASGWKTILNIDNFELNNPDEIATKKQEFVAIDRFHGGGKDGAKFDATHAEHPEFSGAITFSLRMEKNNLSWAKGMLALVLRDLQEGDLSFGFGANKGYGGLESVSITGLEQLNDEDIQAFRDKCIESAQTWVCKKTQPPTAQNENKPLNDTQAANHGFHNPYHFIPVNKPETEHWTDKSALNADSHHSHGFYRNQTETGEQLYHGRLTCRLLTETPTFIGADKVDNTESAEINHYRLNNEIAIPATSLRGMISSLAEAASNSAMRVLDNGLLSYRKPMRNSLSAIGVVVKKDDRWHIIPLALPSLKLNQKENTYDVPREYRVMFPDGHAKLKIYLHNAFTNNINNVTWTRDNNKVFYLGLTAPLKTTNGHIQNSQTLRKPRNNQGFAIGQKYLENSILTEYSEPGTSPGLLRIFGGSLRPDIPNTKKHEIFIPIPTSYVNHNQFDYQKFIVNEPSFLIPSEVVDRFEELADQRTNSQNNISNDEEWLPYHLKGMQRTSNHKLSLKEGDLVYFSPNKSHNELVEEISFSSIWRDRVETSAGQANKVHNFIPSDLLPFDNKTRTRISPAELLFGFTEIKENESNPGAASLAFAGKVRISAGIIPEYPKDEILLFEDATTLKALSSPKPPSPSLYFQSKIDKSYISKQKLHPQKHTVKGRKYYLHAMRNNNGVQKLNSTGDAATAGDRELPWKTHDATERPQLKVKIQPIRENQSFYFNLDFSNLTEWELGLLCYALKPTDNFRHRIGMGKPIGLGSVKIDIMMLQTIDRKQRYEQDVITIDRYNQHRWVNSAYKNKLEKAGYKISPTMNPLDPAALRKNYISTMDANIYRALDLLGNPQNIKHPVHYPQIKDNNIEQENYKWFVANDQGSGVSQTKIDAAEDMLEDISDNTDHIPTLIRHRWSDR